jgi:ectoine hydroxylase-related dioxygenase (phytanoyl-CoA dioxygenase family)
MTPATASEAATATSLSDVRKVFDENGYVVVRQALDPNLVAEMGQHIEFLMKHNPGVRPESLGHTLIPDDPFWCRLISDPSLLDIAQQFIGPNIALFASSYFSKPPFDGLPVPWHQDGNYWPLDPQDAVVSLWLAADDSTPENGCMRVIPGTQDMQFQQHVPVSGRNALGSKLPAEFVDESKAVDVILKAGDVSIHGPNIIHGSNANTSPHRRCGLTIRYIPTSTRITRGIRGWPDEQWPCCFLLRGKAVPGVNEYVQMPKYVAGKHMPFRGCERWM